MTKTGRRAATASRGGAKTGSRSAKANRGGWKTCSRGHHYRGAMCPQCWPGGVEDGKRTR